MASQLKVGDRVWLYYSREDGFWHERVLLCKSDGGGKTWAVCTPHLDIYEEDLGEAEQMLRGGIRGGIPCAGLWPEHGSLLALRR